MKVRFGIILAITSSLVLSACTQTSSYYYAYDKGDCKSTRFDDVDSSLDISTKWKYETIYLTWNEYEEEGFNGYYIVKTDGDSDSCPFYYIGGDYEEYIGKRSVTYFKDDDIESGKSYYYRVCVKQDNKEIDCGSVKRIDIY